jgi:Cas6b C-terminal domain/Cas6b N-terminal domain
MHSLATHPYTEIELCWSAPVPGAGELRARQLRGALAEAFGADSLFHQRDTAGREIYRYPLIQYRWADGRGLVIGWRQAADLLRRLPWLDLDLELGAERVQVTDAHVTCRSGEFGAGPRLLHYHFASPVLLFNQDNYRRYQVLPPQEHRREHDRLLTAQMLTALRGLDVEFPQHLYATLVDPRPCPARYKGQDLLGLTGRLVCNAVLPTGFAFGHAVSHGYGWLVAAEEG